MNAASSILIAVLAALPVAPPSDEVSAVIEACGGPQWTSRSALPQVAPDAAAERMHYPTLDLTFQRNSVSDKWTLSYASLHGKDDAVTTDDALRSLPCLNNARPHLAVFNAETPTVAPAFASAPATKPATAPRPAPYPDTPGPRNPFTIAGIALASFGLIVLLIRYTSRRRRSTRSYSGWLCTTCYVVSIPELDENDEMHCSVCGYGTPIPFDSSEAKEYFSTRNLKARSLSQNTREQEV
jgi:hypothetical protein